MSLMRSVESSRRSVHASSIDRKEDGKRVFRKFAEEVGDLAAPAAAELPAAVSAAAPNPHLIQRLQSRIQWRQYRPAIWVGDLVEVGRSFDRGN